MNTQPAGLTGDLIRHLIRARERTPDPGRDGAVLQVKESILEIDSSRDLGLDIPAVLALARLLASTQDPALARKLSRTLTTASSRASNLTRPRMSTTLTRPDPTRRREPKLVCVITERDVALANALADASTCAGNLVTTIKLAKGTVTKQQHSIVALSAGRLLRIAGLLLPAPDRARYLEEFGAELLDLAELGTGRWRQILYAVRLITQAGHLRIELMATIPRRASP